MKQLNTMTLEELDSKIDQLQKELKVCTMHIADYDRDTLESLSDMQHKIILTTQAYDDLREEYLQRCKDNAESIKNIRSRLEEAQAMRSTLISHQNND